MLSIVADGDEFDVSSFSSLEGIVTMFKDSSNVFAGWIHYLAFDALVGRWIVMDLTKRGASTQFHFAVVVRRRFAKPYVSRPKTHNLSPERRATKLRGF